MSLTRKVKDFNPSRARSLSESYSNTNIPMKAAACKVAQEDGVAVCKQNHLWATNTTDLAIFGARLGKLLLLLAMLSKLEQEFEL